MQWWTLKTDSGDKALFRDYPAAIFLLAIFALVPASFFWKPAAAFGAAEDLPVVVLLGDSLTRRSDWSELKGKGAIVNHGIDGDELPWMLQRLSFSLSLRPSVIVFQGGINDLVRGRSVSEVVRYHELIWEAILASEPPVKLVVCSLLTVNPSIGGSAAARVNKLVLEANGILAEKAKGGRVRFIDLNRALAGPGEALGDDLTVPDGLHLSEKAYGLWAEALIPHL